LRHRAPTRAWISGRSWIVGPDAGALYIIGFPALFLCLGARELPTWMELRRARRLARTRTAGWTRPWQYVAAGAMLGASAVVIGAVILRIF
jgi:hypothetical protein